MKRKTHKVIEKNSDLEKIVFVGIEKDCKNFLNKINNKSEFSIIPLSKKSFEYKVIDIETNKILCQNTEKNLYHFIDLQYGMENKDCLKVIKLTEDEIKYYKVLYPPQIQKID